MCMPPTARCGTTFANGALLREGGSLRPPLLLHL